jgi:hypothetical protein
MTEETTMLLVAVGHRKVLRCDKVAIKCEVTHETPSNAEVKTTWNYIFRRLHSVDQKMTVSGRRAVWSHRYLPTFQRCLLPV